MNYEKDIEGTVWTVRYIVCIPNCPCQLSSELLRDSAQSVTDQIVNFQNINPKHYQLLKPLV